MLKHYFAIAYRNLIRHKTYSIINIAGLALGMAVALLIGFWVHDELTFNKSHENYKRIAMVMQNNTVDNEIETSETHSMQLGPVLRTNYGNYFEHVVMSSFARSTILSHKDKVISKVGCFMEGAAPELLTLTMVHGTREGLKDPGSILLSQAAAIAFFGDADPVGEVLTLDNELEVAVTGVYQDLPHNSDFYGVAFISPLDDLLKIEKVNTGWINNWLMVLVQVSEQTSIEQASLAIKSAKLDNVSESIARYKPELFLQSMEDGHLYTVFRNGVPVGGRIDFVWLFGMIGLFVLLLACINFMNLSTARSEKRAKEVGVRKMVGSVRSLLVGQFLCESLLVVTVSFIFSTFLVQAFLPAFNQIAGKEIDIDWAEPQLWMVITGFVLLIGLVAGSYPAFYLSAFKPVKVLKGSFKAGRYASLPRKVLVVLQFTVSVTLIVGTMVVYKQIQFAKNRPAGYDREGLIAIPIKTDEVKKHYAAMRNDLIATGAIAEVSMSECIATDLWWSDSGVEWEGKDPDMQDKMYRGAVNHEYGKTVGWKIKEGRDFSRDFPTDSSAVILNEAAVSYMGMADPVGKTIKAYGNNRTIIGVVEDMVTQSLYQPAKQTMFIIASENRLNYIHVKISPQVGVGQALATIEPIFKAHNPATPFEYRFVDEQFANKYAFEVRLGTLAGIFAILAVLISSLGLFGLASFVAEQRTKEIGIRKVLGASIGSIWGLLSKEFLLLVSISCLISTPIALFLINDYLGNYEYQTEVSWRVFALAGAGAIGITVVSVSFQVIKAALQNPVKSLRTE